MVLVMNYMCREHNVMGRGHAGHRDRAWIGASAHGCRAPEVKERTWVQERDKHSHYTALLPHLATNDLQGSENISAWT